MSHPMMHTYFFTATVELQDTDSISPEHTENAKIWGTMTFPGEPALEDVINAMNAEVNRKVSIEMPGKSVINVYTTALNELTGLNHSNINSTGA